MSDHYNEYIINTPDIHRTKEEIRAHLQAATAMLLTVSAYENGHSITRQVEFIPKEIPATKFVVAQGIIQPENTEASIQKEDNYLLLIAALDNE